MLAPLFIIQSTQALLVEPKEAAIKQEVARVMRKWLFALSVLLNGPGLLHIAAGHTAHRDHLLWENESACHKNQHKNVPAAEFCHLLGRWADGHGLLVEAD